MPILNMIYGATGGGGGGGWQPGANTLLYMSFTGNYNDTMGNIVSLEQGTAPSYGTTAQGEEYASISQLGLLSTTLSTVDLNDMTVSCRLYSTNTSPEVVYFIGGNYGSGSSAGYGNGLVLDGNAKIVLFPYAADINTNVQITRNAWHNIIYTVGNGTIKVYVDGVEVYSLLHTFNQQSNIVRFFKDPYNNTSAPYIGNFDEFIIEDIEWSAQEVADYFNQTKANYGIS